MQGLNGFHSPYHMMQGNQAMYPQPHPMQGGQMMQSQMAPQMAPQMQHQMPSFGMGGHLQQLYDRLPGKAGGSLGGLLGMAK
jgi:hypothetical protein